MRVCIRPGIYRNATLTFQSDNSTISSKNASVWVGPSEKGAFVGFQDGWRRCLTFINISFVRIQNISLSNTSDANGGCLAILDARSVLLSHLWIEGCFAKEKYGNGGAIACVNCQVLSIVSSVIDGGVPSPLWPTEYGAPVAGGYGGLLFVEWTKGNEQKVVLKDSVFRRGVGLSGGCLAVASNCGEEGCGNNASVTFSNAFFDSCVGQLYGGAVIVETSGPGGGNGMTVSAEGWSLFYDCRCNGGGGAGFFIGGWGTKNSLNNVSIRLSDSSGFFRCKNEGGYGGGAIMVGYGGITEMSNGNTFSLTMTDESFIRECYSYENGGGIYLEGMLNEAVVLLEKNSTVTDCFSRGNGGVFMTDYEHFGGQGGIEFILRDNVTVFNCSALLTGGFMSFSWSNNAEEMEEPVSPFVVVSMTNGVFLSSISAALGGFIHAKEMNLELILQDVTVTDVTATTGAVLLWVITKEQMSLSVSTQSVAFSHIFGTIFFAYAINTRHGVIVNASVDLSMRDVALSDLTTNGDNALIKSVHISTIQINCVNAIMRNVVSTGSSSEDAPVETGSNIIGIVSATAAAISLTNCLIENVCLQDSPKSSVIYSNSPLRLVTENIVMRDIVFSRVVSGSLMTMTPSSEVYLFNSTFAVQIGDLDSGHSFELLNQGSASFEVPPGSLFVIRCVFEIETNAVDGSVAIITSFPSSRFFSAANSRTLSLMRGFGRLQDVVYIPWQWVETGRRVMPLAPWPPIWTVEESAFDDDFMMYQIDDDVQPVSNLNTLVRQVGTNWAFTRNSTILPVFSYFWEYDNTYWGCSKGYQIEAYQENAAVSSMPILRPDCTLGGTGPNACSYFSFATSISCRPCPPGSFSPRAGTIDKDGATAVVCLSCGSGAVCPGRAALSVLRGYWGSPRMADAKTDSRTAAVTSLDGLVVRCPPGYCCLPENGTESCPLYSRGVWQGVETTRLCQEFRNGTLCGRCQDSYSFRLLGSGCIPTVDEEGRLELALCLLAIACFVYTFVQAHRSLSRSRASLQLITYFFSTISLIYEPLGAGSSTWTGSILSVITSIFNGFDFNVRHPSVSLSANRSSGSAVLSAIDYLDAPLWPSATGTDKLLMSLFPIAMMLLSLLFLLCISAAVQKKKQKENKLRKTRLSPSLNGSELSSCSKTGRIKSFWIVPMERGAAALYNIFLFTYGSLLTSSLRLLSCTWVRDPVTGLSVQVRTYAGEEQCWTGEVHAVILGLVACFVLGSLPLVVVFLHAAIVVNRRRGRERRSWMRRLLLITTYLESPYHPQCWWYETFLLLRRLVLAAVVTQLMDSPFARCFVVVCLLGAFIAADGSIVPFRSREDQTAAMVLQFALVILAVLSIGQALMTTLDISFSVTPNREDLFDSLSVVQFVVIMIGVIYTIVVLVRFCLPVLKRTLLWLRKRYGGSRRAKTGLSSSCRSAKEADKTWVSLDYVVVDNNSY